MLTDAQGNPMQVLSLKDPDALRASISNPDADIMRECVVPLLLDIRNLNVAILNSLGATGMQGFAQAQCRQLAQLIDLMNASLQEKAVRSKIIT